MIALLNGRVEEKNLDKIILDVSGVGYEVYVTVNDQSRLDSGSSIKLYIYEHIREQSHDLFGFVQKTDKLLFEQLLSVNGVGPKMALSILNIGTGQELKSAIAGGQVKVLQSASGVGKKVAERIVVDLKDKLGLSSSDDATSFLSDSSSNLGDEAHSALMALGYSSQDAMEALRGIDSGLGTEDRIRQALKGARR
jgi:Holliday junction DNA helicase RuvA